MGNLEEIKIDGVYNNFDRNKGYKFVSFNAGKPSQTAEMNEMQSIRKDEMRVLVESLFGSGKIMKGGKCIFNPGTCNTTHIICNSSDTLSSGDYFIIDTPIPGKNYYVWMNVSGFIDPLIPDRVGIPVPLGYTDNSTDVANAIALALQTNTNADDDLTVSVDTNKVIIANRNIGFTNPTTDGEDNSVIPGDNGNATGFIFETTVIGALTSCLLENTVFFAEDSTVDISEAQIDTSGITDNIGVAITRSVITYLEDPELLNPAISTLNEGESGASRIKISGRWVKESQALSTETFYPVHKFENGILVTPQIENPQFEPIKDLIATYDRDANGNFIVEGYSIIFDTNIENEFDVTTAHQMILSSGKAHVDGKLVNYNYSRKFNINPVLPDAGTQLVSNEAINYINPGWFTLVNKPLESVSEVNGTKNGSIIIVRGTGEQDYINTEWTPLYAITNCYNSTTTFIENEHFKIEGNSFIWDWLGRDPLKDKPSQGTSYNVYLQSAHTITLREDQINYDTSSIYLEGFTTKTRVYIDYEFYLNRVDRVTLLSDGTINILEGKYSTTSPVPPEWTSGMSIATVLVKYNTIPKVTSSYYRAFKMSDVQAIYDRLDALQYNVARLSLLEKVNSGDPTTVKINQNVDTFDSDLQRDLTYPQDALVLGGLLIPGYNLQTDTLTLDDDWYYLDYTNTNYINQYKFTKSRQVNAFMWREPPPLTVSITPNPYTWVAKTNVVSLIKNIITGERHGETWHPGWRNENAVWMETTDTSTTKTESSEVSSEVFTVPTIQLTLKAKRLNKGEAATIEFDGKVVQGTFLADVEGYLTAKFMLPDGTKSGSKKVKVEGQYNHQKGSTVWVAVPIVKNVLEITTKTQVKVLEDPVAEVFLMSDDRFICSASIQVTALPDEYLDVYILPTVVGYPDRDNGICVKRLYRSDLVLSTDSATLAGRTFVWNRFTFDVPVLLKSGVEYTVVVSCTDSNCLVRCCKIGDYELTENKWQTTQALPSGVMLESSTGSTWTALHEYDLTFLLGAAKFDKSPIIDNKHTKIVDFGNINVTNCTDIFLTTTFDEYPDTNAAYYITLLDKVPVEKREIVPYRYFEMSTYNGQVNVSCELTTGIDNIWRSPIISGSVSLSWGNVILPSEYIGRYFNIDLVATHMKANLDIYEAISNMVTLYFYTDYTTMFTFSNTNTSVGVPHTSTITTLAGRTLQGGEYFTFETFTPNKKYYVYFTLAGVGRDPKTHNDVSDILNGYDPIPVDIFLSDSEDQIASRINAALLTVPGINKSIANNVLTLTNTEVGSCQLTEDGAGWRSMIRTGDNKDAGYGFQDTQFITSLYDGTPMPESEKHMKKLIKTKMKIVLDSPDVLQRPSVANLRTYLYERNN